MIKKRRLKKILFKEREKYISKSFEDLSKITEPIVYECSSGKSCYQVEVQLIEKNEEYIHVSIAIDDKSLIRAIFPFSTSFIIYRNDKIKKE